MNTLERLKLTNLLKKTVDERNAESNTLKRLKLANQVQELRKQLGLIVVEPLTPQQGINEPNGNVNPSTYQGKTRHELNEQFNLPKQALDYLQDGYDDFIESVNNGEYYQFAGENWQEVVKTEKQRLANAGVAIPTMQELLDNQSYLAVTYWQKEYNDTVSLIERLRDNKIKGTSITGSGVLGAKTKAYYQLGRQMAERELALKNPELSTVAVVNYGGKLRKIQTENSNTMQAHFNKKIADALIHKNHKVLDVSQVSKVYKIPKHIKNIAFYKNLYGLNELSNLFFAIVENEQGEIYANAYIADTAIDLSRLKHDGVFPDIGVTQLMTEEVEALRSLHNDLDAYFTSYENLNRANKKIIKGRTNSVKTAKGTKIDTVFALVDSKYVIASHTENGNENPKYDQSLQPRDRSRESSIAWVSKTANNLDPESLGRTGRADTGAPIIGDDMMVESGNGRTMAIKLAYKNGKAEEYRQWLIDEADMFGFTEAQVSQFKEPILVRIRTSEIDRATFANYTYKMLHLDCIFKA